MILPPLLRMLDHTLEPTPTVVEQGGGGVVMHVVIVLLTVRVTTSA
jgi:hypothetical protein